MNVQGKNLSIYQITFLILALVISACGSTFVKPGYWTYEQTGMDVDAHVTFDLSDAGNITDFKMTAFLGHGYPREKCSFEIDQTKLQVKPDGTFVISYFMEYADLEKQLGDAVMSLGFIPEDKPYEILHISGIVTDTIMTGAYEVKVCGRALLFDNNTGSWNAEWKAP